MIMRITPPSADQGRGRTSPPTSNMCTRCVPSIAGNPLRGMVDAGLLVTLSSDDPPMFGTSLSNEHLVAEPWRMSSVWVQAGWCMSSAWV
jgi:adenosine deaminase